VAGVPSKEAGCMLGLTWMSFTGLSREVFSLTLLFLLSFSICVLPHNISLIVVFEDNNCIAHWTNLATQWPFVLS
jgi:hypothetical protein